jgi:hypothetical protein
MNTSSKGIEFQISLVSSLVEMYFKMHGIVQLLEPFYFFQQYTSIIVLH